MPQTIAADEFTGGARLAVNDDQGLAAKMRLLVDDNTELRTQFETLIAKLDTDFGAQNQISGLTCLPPTNASTQATGATGDMDWNVDITEGFVVVNAVELAFAVDADFDVFSAASAVVDGNSQVGALVASEAAGTVSLEMVFGAAATTGTEVAPTDAEITTGVGHARWVKIAELTINRTGDTTVTQSQANAARDSGDTDYASTAALATQQLTKA